MANLPKPDRLTSLPRVSAPAICSSVASIASLAWPLLRPVSSATARASSVLLMVPTAVPPVDGPMNGATVRRAVDGKPLRGSATRANEVRAKRSTKSIAAPSHRGQDHQHVAVADLGLQALQHPDVLVV